ncbi:MAG: transglycosylase family protein [Microthrixaceae bacterium]
MDDHLTPSPRTRRLRATSRVLLAATVVLGLCWSVHLAGASPHSVDAARQRLRTATADRLRAEETVAERASALSELESELAGLGALDASLTEELAQARRELREYAVAAYIDGGQSEVFRSALSPEQAMALSWQSNIAMGQSGSADEAAHRFAALKEANSPARLESAARVDQATRELEEARYDAIQAAAFERDAEAALARAQAAEAAAAQAAARERAAAAATAATQPKATSTRAPAASGASAPVAVEAPVAEAPSPSSGAMGDPSPAESATLARIRHCESRGNYSIVSASGRYRGAYQFNYGTWAAVGGSGDPAAASPAEQDYRALLLLRQRGTRPWPHCGR